MYEDFVPERLAKLRTQKGVSARDMSLSLGQANNYINNIENKNHFLHAVFFYICEYLGVTLWNSLTKETCTRKPARIRCGGKAARS